jgi:glycosyltransferase involved in cell wall biosynthesis
MKVSVIICTHNRASLLYDLLSSFKNQTISPSEYELIVVDNASSDKTKDVVERSAKDTKILRYYYEPELGLSRARNLGIGKANGEIVAFIDDDAIPESDWLEVLIDTFEKFSPVPICVGGKILPKWEAPKPSWLPEGTKLQHLSLLDWGDQPRWLRTPSLFAGNLAIKKTAFSCIGEFSNELGRKGDTLISMEEILFLFLVLQMYGPQSLLYEPKAIVHHRIPEERIASRRYIVRRSYWDGASKALMKTIISRRDFRESIGSSWFQLIRYTKLGGMTESSLKLVRGSGLGLQAFICMDSRKLTECLLDLGFGLGGLIELVKGFFSSKNIRMLLINLWIPASLFLYFYLYRDEILGAMKGMIQWLI